MIIPETLTDASTMRERKGVSIHIGQEHGGIENCEKICLSKPEWIDLKKKVNQAFK